MILEAAGIGRKAGNRWLLEDVSLALHAGDRLALVGPSGSGKTLLLRCLAMLDPVDAGAIRWRGKSLHGGEVPHYRSRVIYLHQRPALLEGSVEDNLRQPFSLGIHRQRQFHRSRIAAWLESLDRDETFLLKQQRDLSGGEAQLTALLRAMQLNPDVLLLDEPTAALDPEATGMVESLVTNWSAEKPLERALVWVSHNPVQARRISTEAIHIRGGRVDGEP